MSNKYDELLEFVETGLDHELYEKVCGDCKAESCDDSDCPGNCPGTEITLEVANQICSEVLELMKRLVQSVEVASNDQ